MSNEFMKNMDKHLMIGGLSTGLFYATGIIKGQQILPFFVATTAIAHIGDKYIESNQKEYSEYTDDTEDQDHNKDNEIDTVNDILGIGKLHKTCKKKPHFIN